MNMVVTKWIPLGLYKNRKMLPYFRGTIFNSKSKMYRNFVRDLCTFLYLFY